MSPNVATRLQLELLLIRRIRQKGGLNTRIPLSIKRKLVLWTIGGRLRRRSTGPVERYGDLLVNFYARGISRCLLVGSLDRGKRAYSPGPKA